MKLVVGLGNPGKEYEKTYHNIGFMSVDILLNKLNIDQKEKNEGKAKTVHLSFEGQKIIVAKPQTYMNLSGESVLALMSKYKLTPRDVFVFADDVDLNKGQVRFREKGSGGTHNGLRNIVNHIGQDFNRIKIGISKDENRPLYDYVLSRIDQESMDQIQPAIEKGVDLLLERLNEK